MKQIRLEHFRCYADQTIRFKPGVNLLIGDNASGKTSVLRACKYVLSAFFCGFSDENTRWVSPGDDDFTVRGSDEVLASERPIKIQFSCDADQYETIQFEQDTFYNPGVDQELYTLQKNSKKNTRALVSGITQYRDYANLLQETYTLDVDNVIYRRHALPLIACFSTEDIHAISKIYPRKFLPYAQKASFGYYECLDGNGFFPYWLKRLLVLQEGQKNLQEIEIVRNAIMKALGREGCDIIYDMHVRPIQKKVYYIFADGREVEADLLSDGYKRLVNIVTDVSFRCALLNRELYGTESAERTKGTVLIDEVDLHLHPTLQATVLKGLRNAFPNIQFIVTTHAPMVMTGVESNDENIVYKLSYSDSDGYQVEEAETYGMDVSTITNVVLNQTPRDQQVQQQLDDLFELIEDNKKEEAYVLLDAMRTIRGNNLPELTEAETMLNFSIEDDEADSER